MVGDPGHGMVLYAQNCQSCHGSDGEGHIANPGSADMLMPPLKKIDPNIFNADPALFAQNLDRFTQHGSHPEGPSPAFNMPAFGDTRTLTQQQIANIEAYLLQLNGVDRATIVHPGVQPRIFFRGVSIAFAPFVWGWRWRRWADEEVDSQNAAVTPLRAATSSRARRSGRPARDAVRCLISGWVKCPTPTACLCGGTSASTPFSARSGMTSRWLPGRGMKTTCSEYMTR